MDYRMTQILKLQAQAWEWVKFSCYCDHAEVRTFAAQGELIVVVIVNGEQAKEWREYLS